MANSVFCWIRQDCRTRVGLDGRQPPSIYSKKEILRESCFIWAKGLASKGLPVFMCMRVWCHEGLKRTLDPIKLELQAAMSCLLWVLGTVSGPLEEQPGSSHLISSPAPHWPLSRIKTLELSNLPPSVVGTCLSQDGEERYLHLAPH